MSWAESKWIVDNITEKLGRASYDYILAVGGTFHISYAGTYPVVAIEPADALTYRDQGGSVEFTGSTVGEATITLSSTTAEGDTSVNYTVLIVASKELLLQNKSVAPSTSEQTVIYDDTFDGLAAVTVGAIQTEEKSVSPTTSAQTVVPTSGKYLTSVIVGAIQTEEKTAAANGEVVPTDGKYLSKVTVNIPTQSKSVPLDFGSGNQTISPDSGNMLTEVTIQKPDTAIPENIKSGVNIGGIVGTLLPVQYDYTVAVGKAFAINYDDTSPSVTITPSGILTYYDDGGLIEFTGVASGEATVTLSYTTPDGDVKTSYTVLVVASKEIRLQDKTVNATETTQNVTYDSGYDGLGAVTINAAALPTLNAPSIVLNEFLLEIRDTPDNGAFVSSYDIYIDDVFKENIAKIG